MTPICVHALHVKDRKKEQGPGMPLGEGDAPVKEVLRMLRDRGWDIPAHIEFDDRPADPAAGAAVILVIFALLQAQYASPAGSAISKGLRKAIAFLNPSPPDIRLSSCSMLITWS